MLLSQEQFDYLNSASRIQNRESCHDEYVDGSESASGTRLKESASVSENDLDIDSNSSCRRKPFRSDKERERERDGDDLSRIRQKNGLVPKLRDGTDSSIWTLTSTRGGRGGVSQTPVHGQSVRRSNAYIRPTRSSFLKSVQQQPLNLSDKESDLRGMYPPRDGGILGQLAPTQTTTTTPTSEKPNPYRGKQTYLVRERTLGSSSSSNSNFHPQRDRTGAR